MIVTFAVELVKWGRTMTVYETTSMDRAIDFLLRLVGDGENARIVEVKQ